MIPPTLISEINNFNYEHKISEELIFKSWVDGHISDEALLEYCQPIYELLEEEISEIVDDTIDSLFNCVSYGSISEDSKRELSNTKFYGKIFYLFNDENEEAYLTQRDIESALKSNLGKNKTLRELYDEAYIKYDYLVEDLRISRCVTLAISEYATCYHIPFSERYKIAVQDIKEKLNDLTKDDKEIDPITLSATELRQAMHTSISKFIELHQQQLPELMHILVAYENTPLKDYVEVLQDKLQGNIIQDFSLLTEIFTQYKKDTKGRIYNYDLFNFLYYAYGLSVSFEHLYNSKLLRGLGAYTTKADRVKPILKISAINLLERHKQLLDFSQCETNIYIENLINFLSQAKIKQFNYYLISFLFDMSHNFEKSKDFLNSLNGKQYNFKRLKQNSLPQPVDTMLLSHKQIIH